MGQKLSQPTENYWRGFEYAGHSIHTAEPALKEYFKELYTTKHPDAEIIEACGKTQNAELCKAASEKYRSHVDIYLNRIMTDLRNRNVKHEPHSTVRLGETTVRRWDPSIGMIREDVLGPVNQVYYDPIAGRRVESRPVLRSREIEEDEDE